MGRLIDADDLSRRMYFEVFVKETDMQKWDSGCWIRYKLFEDILREQPTIEPELKWIPCQDRLPEEAQECWITAKDGTVLQGMFTRRYGERRDSGFICYGCGFAWLNAVAAWMPYKLPERYQEEGE